MTDKLKKRENKENNNKNDSVIFSGFFQANRPFPSCFDPHYESEAEFKVFFLFVCLFVFYFIFFKTISSHSFARKRN